MIYVPNSEEYACVYVRDTNTIRAYKTTPRQNVEVEYRDFYMNSHYVFVDGVQQFNNYATMPSCLDRTNLTSLYVYRNDFADILLIFILMLCFVWFFVAKPFKLLFLGKKRF